MKNRPPEHESHEQWPREKLPIDVADVHAEGCSAFAVPGAMLAELNKSLVCEVLQLQIAPALSSKHPASMLRQG